VHHSSRRESGFTLLELMMVVFVVGIMASLTVMSIGGNPEREFRRDVARIQQLLVMAQDEAPAAGEEIGFWIDPDGKSYNFLYFEEKKLVWKPLKKEGFTKHETPAQYQLSLEMSGDPVDIAALYKEIYKLDEKLGDDEKDSGPIPWVVFFSDGQYTPFRLWVRNPYVKEFVYVLEGDGLGAVISHQEEANSMPETSHD
jgi:general secretion pathway protein H